VTQQKDKIYLQCEGGPLDGQLQWWHRNDVKLWGVVTWLWPLYAPLVQVHEYEVRPRKWSGRMYAEYRGVRK